MTICQSSSLQSHLAGNAKLYDSEFCLDMSGSGLLPFLCGIQFMIVLDCSHIQFNIVKISDREKYFIPSNLVQNGKDPVYDKSCEKVGYPTVGFQSRLLT